MNPTYPLVPIANFIACALTVIPLFHMVNRPWNTGFYVFTLFLFIESLSVAINTIIWSNDSKDRASVWCDISSHIILLTGAGGPASTFVMTRKLYKITKMRAVMLSKRHKRMELLSELAICVGIPIGVVCLYYIVQGARYEILEELGCIDAGEPSGVSIILIGTWSVIFPFISLVFYAPQIIYTIYRQRKEINDESSSFNAELNESHFFRMFALGCFDSFITLPISITSLVTNVVRSRRLFSFYQGWASIHSNWEPVLFPKSIWSEFKWSVFSVYWDEWVNPFYALVFFALFGLTPEARKEYRKFFRSLRRPFGFKQGDNMEEELPKLAFKSPSDTNATTTSHISNSTQIDAMA